MQVGPKRECGKKKVLAILGLLKDYMSMNLTIYLDKLAIDWNGSISLIHSRF